MAKLFANSGDPDQMPCSVASDLGLLCLSITLLGVSRLQCINVSEKMQHEWQSADPDQMPHSAASDLVLHCLLRPVSPNTLGYYGTLMQNNNKTTCVINYLLNYHIIWS